jgi:ABC-type sulfate transport system permease component
VNISIEDFINWQTKTSILASTLTMMFITFISFSIISAIKTSQTNNILKGIKSSFISALLGTLIALCFGFLINYLFPDKMVAILRNDPGFNEYTNPNAFTFLMPLTMLPIM